MDPIEQFVQSFYSIEGVTLGERSKNVNLLVRNFTKINLNNEDLKRMNTLLQARNILEETFKLDVFLQLRYVAFLLSIFEGEKLNLIGRLVKSKWLFQEEFCSINSDFLIDLFKRVSPITRGKIINKLAALKNETVAEDFYVTIKSHYGFKAASKLLPACSVTFIRSLLENQCIEFSDKQLLRIIKKDLQFAPIYFNKIKKNMIHVELGDYLRSLHYVASIDLIIFAEFIEKYRIRMKLNARLTAKIYEIKKDKVIANPTFYLSIMHFKTLIHLLKDDYNEFYKNSFPKSIEEFRHTIGEPSTVRYNQYTRTYTLINHLSRDEQYKMLVNTFREVYKVDIFDYPDFIKNHFIEMMPIDVRVKWAKEKMKDDKWMCYLEIKHSIPKIKEKINLSSDRYARAKCTLYLIETCRINKDKDALLEVLKYYFERHRNEEGDLRAQFVREISSSFKLENLPQTHWTELMKLLQLFVIKEDYHFETRFFIGRYLLYLFKTNQINDDAILKYLKEAFKNKNIQMPRDYPSKYTKLLLLSLPEIILNNYEGDELFDITLAFISEIFSWNQDNPWDKINPYDFPKIMDVMLCKEIEKREDNRRYKSTVSSLIDFKSNEPQNPIFLNIFWSSIEEHSYNYRNVFEDILKYKPLLILENNAKFSTFLYFGDSFITKLKYYAHLGLPQLFKEMYVAKLTSDSKSGAIKNLVHLMPTQEYINLMSDYYVKESKIDVEEEKSIYKLQSYFIESLKYADELSLTLPIVEQFCVGDYLKMSLDTLYRVIDYTPMPKTEHFLKSLFYRAVSVRKHAIFLTSNTRDERTVYDMIKTLAPKEKNPSLLKFLFKRTFKYFCVNPSEQFFELLRLNSQYINKKDEEAYNYFKEYSNVPSDYLPRFIVLGWNCMSVSEVENVRNEKNSLLHNINVNVIKRLPDTFCRKIIKSYLFSDERFILPTFSCNYILAGENDDNLRFVCDVLKDFMKSDQTKKHDKMQTILEHFCSKFRENNLIDYLNKFANIWYEFVEVVDAYGQHLMLQFNILYLNAVDDDYECKIRKFAENVCKFFDENLEKYGCMIINVFADVLESCSKTFLWHETKLDENLFNFYTDLLNINDSPYNCALILTMLPKKFALQPDIKFKHEFILNEIISKRQEEWLKILYVNYCQAM